MENELGLADEDGIYMSDDQSDTLDEPKSSGQEHRLADFDDDDQSDEEIEKFKRPAPELQRVNLVSADSTSDILSRKSVEAYLSETGRSVTLIDKNDKKFVKVNISAEKQKQVQAEAPKLKIVEMLDLRAHRYSLDETNESGMIFSEKDLEKLLGLSAAEFNSQLDNIECERMTESSDTDDEPIALRFLCNKCDERFESESELAQHHGRAHSKRFDCGICGMFFYDLSSKNRHEKEHAGIKPFRCYICSYEFTRASNLRAHLLKLHPGQVGKSVKITKTIDNKLQFEFNLDMINQQKEQLSHLQTVKVNDLSNLAPFAKSGKTKSTSYYVQNKSKYGYRDKYANDNKSNAVIYIKDPNDKNGSIQHMVVYVDGKPIFVKNPLPSDASIKSGEFADTNKQSAKIPYLLAVAAAREQQQMASNHAAQFPTEIDQRIKNRKRLHSQTSDSKEGSDMEQDYFQLVSMFKQKNQKLNSTLFK